MYWSQWFFGKLIKLLRVSTKNFSYQKLNRLLNNHKTFFSSYKFMRITVGVLLEDLNKKLILQKRSNVEGIVLPGKVTLFGGGIKSGEAPKRAAIREIGEELSLRLALPNISIWKTYKETRGPGHLGYVFVARNIDGTKLQLHEGENIVYLSRGESLDRYDLGPVTRELIEEYWNY